MNIINIGNKFINSYLIPIGDDYVLVDTGGKNSFDKFLARLQEKNIPLTKIKYVFLTHVHSDHAGFLRQLLNKSKATLIYNDKGKARLEAGKNNLNVYVSSLTNLIASYISTAFVDTTQRFPSVKTDNYINFSEQPLKEYDIEFIELAGHTSSDVGLKIGDKFFCGDVCMNGIGSNKRFPAWCENKFELIKSWEKIINDADIVTIYPGHGKPFAKDDLKKYLPYWKEHGVIALFRKKR
ncbi:MAG: MBL fold metallo-hydrolase [Clostridiales bacterium]|nr:MBL fold metallo-hydrolase [Clostridiales bacterium]